MGDQENRDRELENPVIALGLLLALVLLGTVAHLLGLT